MPAPHRRRRVGCLVTVVLAMLLAVGGVLLAEQASRSFVQSLATDAIRSALNTSGDVSVEVRRTPFLPQVIRGTLTEVDVRADQAELRGVELQDVLATAEGVRIRGDRGADSIEVTATVPTSVLQALLQESLGMELTVAQQDGLLLIDGTMAGLPVTAGVEVGVADGAIAATVVHGSIAGLAVDVAQLPEELIGKLGTLGGVVDRLTSQATVDSAQVTAAGLRVQLHLHSVLLSDL